MRVQGPIPGYRGASSAPGNVGHEHVIANLSEVPDDYTARTDPEVTVQRAQVLAGLGVRSVLELCVGPSLRELTAAYETVGITCTGNDLEGRWKRYWDKGSWVLGDALQIPWLGYEAVVFAPPLSRGCTGRREDALRIDDVVPPFTDYLTRLEREPTVKVGVLVLPARSLATRWDRTQFYCLLRRAQGLGLVDTREATVGPRRIRKYVELYVLRP